MNIFMIAKSCRDFFFLTSNPFQQDYIAFLIHFFLAMFLLAVSDAQDLRTGVTGLTFHLAYYFPRVGDSICDRIHPSFTVDNYAEKTASD